MNSYKQKLRAFYHSLTTSEKAIHWLGQLSLFCFALFIGAYLDGAAKYYACIFSLVAAIFAVGLVGLIAIVTRD